MFNDMEIILVDDGSSDSYTLKIESWLARHYSNVRRFAFTDGGSGSASRPRNKGVELATAPYITFLDPDNEAVCDGYARLYKDAVNSGCDLELGNMYKCDTNTRLANYYKSIMNSYGSQEISSKGFHQKTNFISPSIQAMLIRKELIVNNRLQQVVGAAGQDTLFAWQLIQYSKKIRVQNFPIHIYYAQTANSVTNFVHIGFFKKVFLLQIEKVKWLEQSGNMKAFMEQRYDYYTVNWIFNKLSQVKESDEVESAKIVQKIHELYATYYRNTSYDINMFIELCKKEKYKEAVFYIKNKFCNKNKHIYPSLEEFFSLKSKKSKFNVSYKQEKSVITFYNNKILNKNVLYAWVILTNMEKYEKIYQTKYTTDNKFSYDYNKINCGVYKIRAFIKNDDEKQSENVAIIQKNNDGIISVIKMSS